MEEMKFEHALKKLEHIVENLEQGELSLDKALQYFEEGIHLSRFCTKKLDEAEKKVDILLSNANGEKRQEAFEIEKQDT